MGKFDGILICTDLDGTLLRTDKTISDENVEKIEYFKREGGYFTFITGRLPYYSTDAYLAVRPNAPYGCVNGGALYDGVRNTYIWRRELGASAIRLVEHIDERFPEIGIELCAFDNTYFAKESSGTVHHREKTGLPNIPCNYKRFSEPLGKILFCSEDDALLSSAMEALASHELSLKFDLIRSERVMLEILPKGVHKGLALRKLAEHLGIDIRKTVAVGDYDNDVGMLKAAGVGVAVANSSPAALASADYITVSNDEHAIAKVIFDIENGKIKLE